MLAEPEECAMKAPKSAELVALIGLVVGCIVMMNAQGVLFYLGLVLGAGSVFWYASKGMHLRGWVATSEEDLIERLAATNAALARLEALAEAPEKRTERDRLDTQREELWRQISEYGHS
jgi:hypothetical protein